MKERFKQQLASHGTVVWADHQQQGRGRLGRSWQSPAGHNIYTSIALVVPPHRLNGPISLLTGAALAHALSTAVGCPAALKWPNDVIIEGRKCAGILVEAGTDPVPFAIVGIGINVNGVLSSQLPTAVALEEVVGRPLDRGQLWCALWESFERHYDQWLREGDAWAVDAWTRYNVTLGSAVLVVAPGEDAWSGRAERIDPDGSLWVRCDRGGVKRVVAGEVSLRRPQGGYW